MTLRSLLYAVARWIGDFEAARHGRLPERIVRRAAWREVSRVLRKMLR